MRVLIMLLAIAAVAITGAVPAAAQQPSSAAAPKRVVAARAAKPVATAAAPVNLNTATQAQLESLPGVGVKAAERILEYRQKNGNFKKVEDLMNVKGIGEKSFLKLKPLLTVTQKAAPAGVSDR
jgi:competence protein ComEA